MSNGTPYIIIQLPKTVEQILAEAEDANTQYQVEVGEKTAIDKANKEFFDATKKYWGVLVPILAVCILVIISAYSLKGKKDGLKISIQGTNELK